MTVILKKAALASIAAGEGNTRISLPCDYTRTSPWREYAKMRAVVPVRGRTLVE
jgi:hypothetical protein